MIRSKAIEDRHRFQRLDTKTLDSQFRRRIGLATFKKAH